MSSIHIRNVAPTTLEALKRLARSHSRSLQGELHAILERAPKMAPPDNELRALNLVTVNTGHTTSWSRDEIYGLDGR